MIRSSDVEKEMKLDRQIILATVQVLKEKGLSRASVREIAKQAAVSVGAVQHYYPSKDQLVAEAVAEIYIRLSRELGAMKRASAPEDLAHDTLQLLWRFYTGPDYLAASEVMMRARLSGDPGHLVGAARKALGMELFSAWDRALANTPLAGRRGHPLLMFIAATLRGLSLVYDGHENQPVIEKQLELLEHIFVESLRTGQVLGMREVEESIPPFSFT